MEFAVVHSISLGVQVTVVEMMVTKSWVGMDKELSALLRAEYAKEVLNSCLVRKWSACRKRKKGLLFLMENAEGNGQCHCQRSC